MLIIDRSIGYDGDNVSSVDNIFGVVQFFAIAIIMVVFLVVWATISSDTALTDTLFSSSEGDAIKSNTNNFFVKTDNLLLVIYFGIHIGIIVLAFLLRTHPIMYLVGFMLILIMMILSPIIANTYESLMDADSFSGVSGDVSKTTYIFSRLPTFELIWMVFTSIIMFGLARFEGLV